MATTLLRQTQVNGLVADLAAKVAATDLFQDGKVKVALLPDTAVGALSYQGVWNAATNAPALPAAAANNKGFYYKVSVAGTASVDGNADWMIGDWVVSNGGVWDKIDNTEKAETAATTSYDNGSSGLAATTAQGAIDEIEARVDTAQTAIGALASLTTSAQGSLVAAINELQAELNAATPATSYVRETPAGTVNGSNAVFTLGFAPQSGTVQIYLNGQLLEPADDYTVAGTAVTLAIAPVSGDKVRAIYFR